VIKTPFGEVQVTEDGVMDFPQGIPGFSDQHKFILVPSGEESPFLLLQSLDDVNISFVVVNPRSFFQDYEVKVSQEDLQLLELESLEDGLLLVILVVASDPKQITANLQAPVLVNPKKRKAKQIIMNDAKYTTKHRLLA